MNGVETPLPGIEIAALPYDRDSVLAALEQRAPTGRPHTRELDSLFQAFRAPFLAFSRVAWQVEQLGRRRDSLRLLLVRGGTGAPGARELESRLQQVTDSLRLVTPLLSLRRTSLGRARDTLWPRITQYQSDVRGWEHSVYSGYDTIVRGFVRNRLKLGIADTTDANGWAKLQLSSGRWWIYARSPDPQDPNAQWYWNVPAQGDTLRLDPRTARHLPRY